MCSNVLSFSHLGKFFLLGTIFRCVLAYLYEGMSNCWSVRPSVGPSVGNPFFQRGVPTMILLNVLNVLGVLNVRNMPKDASLPCWALFFDAEIIINFFLFFSDDVSYNVIMIAVYDGKIT